MSFAGCIFQEERAAGAGMVDFPAAGLKCHRTSEEENPLARWAWLPIPDPTGSQAGEAAAGCGRNGGYIQRRRWRCLGGCCEFNLSALEAGFAFLVNIEMHISDHTHAVTVFACLSHNTSGNDTLVRLVQGF